MISYDRITPGLYGITEEVGTRIIVEAWLKLIQPLLLRENVCYNYVFDAYAYANHAGENYAFGFFLFRNCLDVKEGMIFRKNYELTVPRAFFSIYWRMAKSECYWSPGQFAQLGRQLSYKNALLQWEQKNSEEIEWCREILEECKKRTYGQY